MAAEVGEQLAASRGAAGELEEERLFSGEYDAGRRAGHRSTPAPAEPTRRTGRRWSCGWSCDGPSGEASRSSCSRPQPGEEAGHQVGHLQVERRERLRPLSAPSAASTGSSGSRPFDSANRRQTCFAGRRGGAGRSRTPARSRSTRTTSRSTPTGRRARAASTSTRPTRPCASPTGRRGSSSSARTSARRPPTGDRDGMLRAKLVEREERERQRGDRGARRARRRTSTSARRSAPTCFTRTRWSRTTGPSYEIGDTQRVLDGDLDGFVRAWLLRDSAR